MSKEYERFLETVRKIVNCRINEVDDDVTKKEADDFVTTVLSAIGGERAKGVVASCLEEQDLEVKAALEAELRYFNAKYGDPPTTESHHYDYTPTSNTPKKIGDVTRAIEDAETVKDSLREILKFPEWLDKSFNILNELLSLFKLN